MRRTAAWPLALVYVALVVYASLYPFEGWREVSVRPWAFIVAPPPPHWTLFDIGINVVGYAPLGFLLCLAWQRATALRHVAMVATVLCGLLSVTMEGLQTWLPARVPSNVDLMLNVLGGWLGAMLAVWMREAGLLLRWQEFRSLWFIEDSRGAIVLLALWPAALLFPVAVPLGLGQVAERLHGALWRIAQGSDFEPFLGAPTLALRPLHGSMEVLCVALGLMIPCLLAGSVAPSFWRRLVVVLIVTTAGLAVTSLSAALTWGPGHALSWLTGTAQSGLMLGLILIAVALVVPRRASAALLLVVLGVQLGLLNQSPSDPYVAHTLQTWEQGRFIRFHGLAQWLGWLWPYVALVHGVFWLSRRRAASTMP